MELFGWDILSLDFWSLLLTIVFIDLLLAGDNAIVIGLAARNLPKQMQKKAVIWGTVGAVLIRVVATMLVVSLLKIPFLLAIGGVLLIWIAYKLLVQEESHDNIKAGTTLWSAIQTIIIADAAMGLDNVIAVAGAAQWLANFAVSSSFPWLSKSVGLPATYAAYTAFSILALIFVYAKVRETKGVELEAMPG